MWDVRPWERRFWKKYDELGGDIADCNVPGLITIEDGGLESSITENDKSLLIHET